MKAYLLCRGLMQYGAASRSQMQCSYCRTWSSIVSPVTRSSALWTTHPHPTAAVSTALTSHPYFTTSHTNNPLKPRPIIHEHISCIRHPCIIPTSATSCAHFFTKSSDTKNKDGEVIKTESVGLYQRFKNAYKEYGKVLVGFHCATSAVWFGMFYYAAVTGIDVIPLLEKMGAGETVIKPFKSGAGDIAVMYLLYKLATPARYTLTIVGTRQTVKLLRKYGYMPPVKEGDSFRDLMKEGRQQAKDKVDDQREKMKGKTDKMKEKYKDKTDEMKEKYKDKTDEMKEKYEMSKDSVKEKISEQKHKLQGVKDKFDEHKLRDRAEDFTEQFEKERMVEKFEDAKNKMKETGQELKDKFDRDDNLRDMKRKFDEASEKVKASASDLKRKIDQDERVQDVKENLDKAKDKLKYSANELKDKIEKK